MSEALTLIGRFGNMAVVASGSDLSRVTVVRHRKGAQYAGRVTRLRPGESVFMASTGVGREPIPFHLRRAAVAFSGGAAMFTGSYAGAQYGWIVSGDVWVDRSTDAKLWAARKLRKATPCQHSPYQTRPIFDKPGPPVAFEYACGHCGHVWKEAAA